MSSDSVKNNTKEEDIYLLYNTVVIIYTKLSPLFRLTQTSYSFFKKMCLFIFMYMNTQELSSESPEEDIGFHYRWL